MPTKLVLGLQHGDEGKGRVVDDLAISWADIVVRFQGGGNAGHTVYDDDGNKKITHTLPVGVLNPRVKNYITKGCVINLVDLYDEIIEHNVKPENLKISAYCPIIEPTHIFRDRFKYQGKIGTTARGIGPAYSDFYARDSILFGDILENPNDSFQTISNRFSEFILNISSFVNEKEFSSQCFKDWNIFKSRYKEAVEYLKDYILDDEYVLQKLYKENFNILLEGAQGSGLDIYSENYPNVTSSSPSVGGAINSTNLNHSQIDEVIGVIKSYKTKVGFGLFPSRNNQDLETFNLIAKEGNEFGATTGRPRACGWLDLDEVNQAIQKNGVTQLCLVKSDVLCNVAPFKVFYKNEFIELPTFNSVTLSDPAFMYLNDFIKDKTGVNVIHYTRSAKRGDIVWSF